MRVHKRRYLDRQPRVGDRIEITRGNLPVGTELIIVRTESVTGNCVWAISNRFRHVQIVHDNQYEIYEDEILEKVGEEVRKKKFLGITYRRQHVEIWKAVE